MQNWKNGVYIVTRLMAALNLKDFQAAGFGGCFMAESGCDPGAYNKAEKSGTFKGSTANGGGYGAGLAQWSLGWKAKIQKQFNRFTPIETWTMDQQLEIVTKGCVSGFLNLLRGTSSAAQATDIVLRGYENGSGGMGTTLRSKESMKSYTWCKKSWIADTGYQTFPDGYIGALASRTSFANKILKMMGSLSASDLAEIGNIAGGGGNYDFGGAGGAGGGVSLDPATIQKLIEQFRNQYPVHSEYETYSGPGGNIFSNANNNAFALAALKDEKSSINSDTGKTKDGKQTRTRIYSTNDSTIILDELKIPTDVSTVNTWANKYVTKKDVDAWEEQQKKQKEEVKKKQEEEKKKKEEEAKNSSTGNSSTGNSSTGNSSTGNKNSSTK